MLGKIIVFVIVVGFIMRLLSRSLIGRIYKQAQQQQRNMNQDQQRSTRPSDGNVSVEHAPKKKSSKSADNFKGGDYVDYEEVD
jgi:flagellar biosynthesis/type III secretory pathway M-ring protein FliF/YscJ